MLGSYCYNTKIQFQNLECPISNALPCGIDIGYSGIKVQSPVNASTVPSLVVKCGNDTPILVDSEDIRYMDEGGTVWYAGSLAKKTLQFGSTAVKPSTLLGRQRVQSEDFLIQVRIGLFFAMLKGLTHKGYLIDDRPLKIQTGLPTEFIVQDTEILKEKFIGEHKYQIKIGNRPWMPLRYCIGEKDIFVCKQPFGTLMSGVADDKGAMCNLELLKKNLLILDAGFHTTDTFHCIQGAKEGTSLTWENYSMQEVYQRTCADILKATGNRADISVYSLEKAFESEIIYYGAKKESYYFAKDFYKNLKEICAELLRELDASYSSMINVDVILLTGGTGAAWEKYIREHYKDTGALEIVLAGGENPARANVTGYYNLLMTRLK